MTALQIWRLASSEIRVLFVTSMFVNLGFYALIPYLSLYLTGSFMWSMTLAGVLLGVRQFSQQGITFLGGMIADRWGCKPTLIAGMFVRSAGFTYFAFCHETWQFFTAAVLSGLGGALFEPSIQAAFAKLTPEAYRKPFFSFKNTIVNVAMTASTLLGSLLISIDFLYLSAAAGLIYSCLAFYIMRKLPPLEISIRRQSVIKNISVIVRDVPFVSFTAILIGYYFLYMQLYLTIPKYAAYVTGQQNSVAYLYAAVSVTVILFQLRVTKVLQRFANPFPTIGMGTLVMGLALLLTGFAKGIVMLCFCSVLFALGTMIVAPLLLDVIPLFAAPGQLASYYGFNGYSLAIGGALSTSLGGFLYDWGAGIGIMLLPWLVCFVISVIVAGCLFSFKDRQTRFMQKNAVVPPGSIS